MLSMLKAHGLDPGPTQRPLLAGAISSLIADVPAAAVFTAFGSLNTLGAAFDMPVVASGMTYATMMVLGGLLYGRVFRRAANDPRGGWLFGLAFGFVLWMLGPIPLLQWLPGRPLLMGFPAMGVLLGHLLWGLVLGSVFPFIHRRLYAGLDPSADKARTGPEAITRQLRAT